MTSDLSNDQLNRAIAEAAGWEPEGDCDVCYGSGTEEVPFSDSLDFGPRYMDCRGCGGTGGDDIYPDFAHSIDAQKPVEKMLRQGAGWDGPDVQWTKGPVTAQWWHVAYGYVGGTADGNDEARARAEALLAALQVKNEVK